MSDARPSHGPRQWRRLDRRLPQPFEPRDGCRITPIGERSHYLDRMLGAIDAANERVDVEMYLWEDDEVGLGFVDALERAHERGCRVRVLADGWGANEVFPALERLATGGADVRVYNPVRVRLLRQLFHRTHKKLLVADGEIAFVGGAGFSLHFSGFKRQERPWHDRMFELTGPVVEDLEAAFEADLGRWRSLARPEARTVRVRPEDEGRDDVGDTRLRVLRGWPDSPDFPKTLLRAVRAAERRIVLGTPYFVPTRKLRKALHGALRRGVSVELVVPDYDGANPLLWWASRRHYGGILRRGGRVFEYGPRFYHAKIAVVDDTVALVGSSNLDGWSWRRNAELDVAVLDAPSVERVLACYEEDREASDEITRAAHRGRSLGHRCVEAVAGLYSRWL